MPCPLPVTVSIKSQTVLFIHVRERGKDVGQQLLVYCLHQLIAYLQDKKTNNLDWEITKYKLNRTWNQTALYDS